MAQTWRQEVQESQDIQGLSGDVAINDVAIDDAAIGVATGQTAVQSATHAISRHRTSIGIVSLALAVVALAIVEGLILRSNTADHVAEMRLILAAGARWAAFVPAAHTIAVCFSAVVAVPVIVSSVIPDSRIRAGMLQFSPASMLTLFVPQLIVTGAEALTLGETGIHSFSRYTVRPSVTATLTVVTVFFSFQGCARMEIGILPLL